MAYPNSHRMYTPCWNLRNPWWGGGNRRCLLILSFSFYKMKKLW